MASGKQFHINTKEKIKLVERRLEYCKKFGNLSQIKGWTESRCYLQLKDRNPHTLETAQVIFFLDLTCI